MEIHVKRLLHSVLAIAAIALQHGAVAQAAEGPAYLVAQVAITDQKRYFEAYGARVAPLLERAGAEIVAATPDRQQLEGDWVGNWTVIIKFPSKDKALEWYRSDAYQTVRLLRLQSTNENNLVLLPSFVPPK